MTEKEENEWTTMRIKRETLQKLRARKVAETMSDDEALQQLLKKTQPQVAIAKEA